MFEIQVKPDFEALLANLRREGTPKRVHFLELFLDGEIKRSIAMRFGIGSDIPNDDPYKWLRFEIELQRFLGYDYVNGGVGGIGFPRGTIPAQDTTEQETQRRGQRNWTDEHTGPIKGWKEFEKYPWPDTKNADTTQLEWLTDNLPDDMCIVAGCHSVFEQVTWLLGYENLCYKIHDDPDLVDAMFNRVGSILHGVAKVLVQFDRIPYLFGGDDMGYKTGPMVSAKTLIEKSFPWHKKSADLAHEHGKLYLLHSCGNLSELMDSLINYVGIDGRHSFEDVIEPVTLAKERYGDRIALLGGIDVDFIARTNEDEIRKRVRETLDICQPGGGYCLGTGNSVANYIPVENYLVMMDEGRRYGKGGA
jgi:uroporphyrinogen decarboxylase